MKQKNNVWIKFYNEGKFSESITFDEVEVKINEMRDYLKENNIHSGDVVIVKEPNSIKTVIIYLTLMKSEIVCVPISLLISDNKLGFIKKNSGAKAIFEKGNLKPLKNKDAKKLRGIATIIYTSGTTGSPKGVCLSCDNWIQNSKSLIKHHRFSKKTILLTPLPLFHVNAHGLAMMTSYLAGFKLILLDKMQDNLLKVVDKEKVTVSSLVPILFERLLEKNPKWKPQTYFKYFVTAAAPLKGNLLRRIKESWRAYVAQGYGLSESTNFSCTLPNNLSEKKYNQIMFPHPSIGIALPGVKIRLKEKNKQGIGELQISSKSNSVKYLAKQKRKNSWLNTGDLGYFKTFEGKKYYYITGRKKEFINRGGEKLSPVELEEELFNFGLRGEFAIISVPDEKYGEEVGLVATKKINKKILKNVPKYRRPKRIIVLKELPYTPSGKIQRKKLSNLVTNGQKNTSN